VLNSRAAALLGEPAAGDAPLTDDALIDRVLALTGPATKEERREDLATVLRRLAGLGLTSIREAGVDGDEFGLFEALRDQGRLALRCDLLWRVAEGSDAGAARDQIAAMPRPGPEGDPYLRLTGVKAFVDGRIADAAIDGAGPDALRLTPGELWQIVTQALRRSAGIGCHAVGDRAVRMVLDAYERALSAGLTRDPGRLVIEHALDCGPDRSGRPIGAAQTVPRDVAFDLYTRRAARLLGRGTHRGVLKPGADADLAAFATDPLSGPPGDLPGTEIMLTLVGGRPVHDPAGVMEEGGGG
jgi:predicted amidohydrolase YtcJ